MKLGFERRRGRGKKRERRNTVKENRSIAHPFTSICIYNIKSHNKRMTIIPWIITKLEIVTKELNITFQEEE